MNFSSKQDVMAFIEHAHNHISNSPYSDASTILCQALRMIDLHPEAGDSFDEEINQADRECIVIAVDWNTGEYLYEYTMPAGTSAIRRSGHQRYGQNVSMSYFSLSDKWIRLIDEQFGIDNLVLVPQGTSPATRIELEQKLKSRAALLRNVTAA